MQRRWCMRSAGELLRMEFEDLEEFFVGSVPRPKPVDRIEPVRVRLRILRVLAGAHARPPVCVRAHRVLHPRATGRCSLSALQLCRT